MSDCCRWLACHRDPHVAGRLFQVLVFLGLLCGVCDGRIAAPPSGHRMAEAPSFLLALALTGIGLYFMSP
jgi:hypothetical protein